MKFVAVSAIVILTICASVKSAPLYNGDGAIAAKIVTGNAHVMLLGDSLQNITAAEYLKRWPVPNFSGQFVGDNVGLNMGAYTEKFSQPWIGVNADHVLPDSVSPSGNNGVAPLATSHIIFYAQPVGAETSLLSNRVYAMDLDVNQSAYYNGGPWADKNTGTVSADLLVYANPNGLASGLKFDIRGNSTTVPLASMPISTFSPTPQLRKYTLTWNAQSFSGAGLEAQVRMIAGTTPTNNSNLVVVGSRIYTSNAGFQFNNLAWGGKGIEYYTDFTSQQNVDDFINETDSDLALVWIGTNDTGSLNKAQYKTKMLDLITKYSHARPNMKFALVATYDVGGAVLPEYADALYEISQSDPNVLFLNLYQQAGNFAFLDSNYLFDHVHPTTAGSQYFADQLYGLISQAVPEPTSLAAFGMLATCLVRRRRRAA